VGRLEGGNDTFGIRKLSKSSQCLVVGRVGVFGPPDILEVGVFGSDGGVVKAGANGVSKFDLTVIVGKEPGFGTLENA
jgi:hypothetical protein